MPTPRTPPPAATTPAGGQVFTRMFPGLPPFGDATDQVRAALMEVGRPGGIMDPGDDLADPVALITDPRSTATRPAATRTGPTRTTRR